MATAIVLNLLAMLSDLAFGPDPDERVPRQAKHLRRMLLCVPTRVIHHARGGDPAPAGGPALGG